MVAFCSGGRIGGRPQWLKPSQRPVTDDDSRNVFTTNIGTRTSMLTIRSLNEGSAGEYTCVLGDVRLPMTIYLDTSEVYTATIGEGESYPFSSPDHPGTYGENLNVTWLITVEDGCRLLIHFETTDMDFGDVISIGSGTNTSSERLWYVAGTAGPTYLEINSTTTWLQFRSNRYTSPRIDYSGFCGTMRAVCGAPEGSGIDMEDGDVYHIASPNYPRNYPKHARVVWVFNLPENCALNVTFLDFRTDAGSFGEVRVGAGIWTSVSRTGGLYGEQLPDPVSVEDTRVYVFFKSGTLRTYKGFRAVIRAQCAQATTQQPTTINIEDVMMLQSDGTPLYITSPYFPNNYPDNADERWDVQAPAGCGITFHFEELSTEVRLDVVYIGDASTDGDFRSTARKFSGTPGELEDFTLSVERARVDFVSDRSVNRLGFDLEIRAQCESGE
ncbi:bone morphogenetic protein 1-like [Diadema setosum]|uniref:bone morphogenetic protein 1-like n=1 Tax=Diadema setosum TaxID=31175 RepID=UPI003B3A27B2